jgi:hypothetical protein
MDRFLQTGRVAMCGGTDYPIQVVDRWGFEMLRIAPFQSEVAAVAGLGI